jgi:hypothetical protein
MGSIRGRREDLLTDYLRGPCLKLSGIIWLEEIIEKIERKYHVTQDEVRKF